MNKFFLVALIAALCVAANASFYDDRGVSLLMNKEAEHQKSAGVFQTEQAATADSDDNDDGSEETEESNNNGGTDGNNNNNNGGTDGNNNNNNGGNNNNNNGGNNNNNNNNNGGNGLVDGAGHKGLIDEQDSASSMFVSFVAVVAAFAYVF